MEHYKKKQSVFFEEECLPNELRITATGKAYDLTTRATHRLKVALFPNPSWAVPTSICEYRGKGLGGWSCVVTLGRQRIDTQVVPNGGLSALSCKPVRLRAGSHSICKAASTYHLF